MVSLLAQTIEIYRGFKGENINPVTRTQAELDATKIKKTLFDAGSVLGLGSTVGHCLAFIATQTPEMFNGALTSAAITDGLYMFSTSTQYKIDELEDMLAKFKAAQPDATRRPKDQPYLF